MIPGLKGKIRNVRILIIAVGYMKKRERKWIIIQAMF